MLALTAADSYEEALELYRKAEELGPQVGGLAIVGGWVGWYVGQGVSELILTLLHECSDVWVTIRNRDRSAFEGGVGGRGR